MSLVAGLAIIGVQTGADIASSQVESSAKSTVESVVQVLQSQGSSGSAQAFLDGNEHRSTQLFNATLKDLLKKTFGDSSRGSNSISALSPGTQKLSSVDQALAKWAVYSRWGNSEKAAPYKQVLESAKKSAQFLEAKSKYLQLMGKSDPPLKTDVTANGPHSPQTTALNTPLVLAGAGVALLILVVASRRVSK